MLKRMILSVAVVLIVSQFALAQEAQDVPKLRKEIAEMQKRLDLLEAQQEKQTDWSESMEWLERIKISGDFRYRYEYIDDEEKSEDRNRNRIRARIKMKAKVNEDTDFILRLATGDRDDPVSTNLTLGDGFKNDQFNLDQAYIDWHPGNLNVYLGKMANPFIRVGKNELIYDDDLTPEGVAMNYAIGLNDYSKILLNAAGFYVNEESAGADTSLWGLQAAYEHEFVDASTLLAGASWYQYGNLEGEPAILGDDDFFGNSFVDEAGTDVYQYDYHLLELFAEYGLKAGNVPVAVYGDYVVNTASNVSEDTGWLVGAKFLKAKKPGDWAFSYNYRDVEADAVVGTYSDSDFIGGGTGGKGHQFGAKYKLAKNVDMGATYFLNEKEGSDFDYDRLQLDLKYKF